MEQVQRRAVKVTATPPHQRQAEKVQPGEQKVVWKPPACSCKVVNELLLLFYFRMQLLLHLLKHLYLHTGILTFSFLILSPDPTAGEGATVGG